MQDHKSSSLQGFWALHVKKQSLVLYSCLAHSTNINPRITLQKTLSNLSDLSFFFPRLCMIFITYQNSYDFMVFVNCFVLCHGNTKPFNTFTYNKSTSQVWPFVDVFICHGRVEVRNVVRRRWINWTWHI